MGRIRDGHIGNREATALITILLIDKIFRYFPREMTKIGYNAGWMIPIFSAILALALFMVISMLMKKFPEKTIIQVNEELTGPFIGFFFSVIIFLVLFFDVVVGLRANMEIIKTTVLPLTPISVLTGLYLLTALYTAYQGIESISRGAWLLSPFILLAIAIIVLGIYPYFKVENLFPILGPGVKNLLINTVNKISLYTEILILAVIFPYLRNSGNLKKIGIFSISVTAIIKTVVVLAYIMAFSIPTAITSTTIPLYQMGRLIFFGRFVQRIEVLFIFIWVFSGLFVISMLLYSSALVLSEALKLPTYKPVLFPLALLLFTLSLIPTDFPQVIFLDVNIIRVYSGLVLIIPVILLAISWLRKKGSESNG